MSNPAIICEVHQTADGYSIFCLEKEKSARPLYYEDGGWWGDSKYHGKRWLNKAYRKNYPFKWRAVLVAKKLEEKMNAERREAERRRNFVERKVWR